MAKVRVHELAKKYGITSREVLAKLSDLGEFVKAASSSVEPPVVLRFEDKYGAELRASQEAAEEAKAAKAAKKAKKAPAKKTAAKKTAATAPADASAATTKDAAVSPTAKKADSAEAAAEPAAPAAGGKKPKVPTPARMDPDAAKAKPATPKPPAKPKQEAADSATKKASPSTDGATPTPPTPAVPSPKPPRPPAGRTGTPRPGNNPFSTTQGMGQRPTRPQRASGGRPGMPRPNPAMMPKSPAAFRGPVEDRGGRGRGGPGLRGDRPRRGFAGRPGGPDAGRPGPDGRGGGRPGGRGRGSRGGRGSTQGAFGRPGGPSRRGRKSRRARRKEFEQMEAPTIGGVRVRKGSGETIRLARGASLSDFADKINVDPASLVQMLFHLGEMVTATESVNDATFELLAEELNYVVKIVSPEDEDRELLESFDLEFGVDEGDDADLAVRPPVVTVMGHVDHGKTSLLDALRNADVGGQEAGGITQHIGAYQVRTAVDGEQRRITFIDTPGHEAFTAMRARGAQATDISVLVVAADDGVMPQTIEALNHAKAAGVPIVVAVNKIDKPSADSTRVRGQLSEYGLVPEEYGGDTMFVDVSAKQNMHLDELLEAIVLTADAALDLRANPEQDAQGLVVEAHLDRGRGPVATVLVQRGTLRVGDSIVAGPAYGRVRAMLNEYGENLTQADPSRPAMVLGLSGVPGAGQNFIVVEDDRVARQIAEKREARERAALQAKRRVRRSLEDFMASMEEGETQELNLILKGDVSGSVEALEDSLATIDVGQNVSIRVIDRGVGAITETNVDLAAASDAIIIGFNVRPQGKATELAEEEGVEIRYYSVIYEAIEEIEAALKGMLKPEYEEAALGKAEIRAIFRSSRIGNIAGCMVTEGLVRRNARVRLIRDGAVVLENGELASLRREKDDAAEVRAGFECGLVIKGFNDIKEGDIVEAFEMREIARD